MNSFPPDFYWVKFAVEVAGLLCLLGGLLLSQIPYPRHGGPNEHSKPDDFGLRWKTRYPKTIGLVIDPHELAVYGDVAHCRLTGYGDERDRHYPGGLHDEAFPNGCASPDCEKYDPCTDPPIPKRFIATVPADPFFTSEFARKWRMLNPGPLLR